MICDGLAKSGFVRKIHKVHIMRRGNRLDVRKQSIDAAIKIVMGQYRRPGWERFNQCRCCRKAARKNECRFCTFKVRQATLETIAGWIAATRIIKSLARSDAVLHICRCMVNRRDYRSGQWIWFLADMDRARCKTSLIARRILGQFSVFLLLVCGAGFAHRALPGSIIILVPNRTSLRSQ